MPNELDNCKGDELVGLALCNEEGDILVDYYRKDFDLKSLQLRLRELLSRVEDLNRMIPVIIPMKDSQTLVMVLDIRPLPRILLGTCKNLIEESFKKFLNRLYMTFLFFVGQLFSDKVIQEKGQFLKMILEVIVKSMRYEFDILEVDFLRRATPPNLRSLCVPADSKLRVIVRERWEYHHGLADEELDEKLLLLTDIKVNNPISGTLQVKTFYDYPLKLAEFPNSQLPLGYHTFAETRYIVSNDSPILFSMNFLEDQKISFQIKNRSELELFDFVLEVDFGMGFQSIFNITQIPNNLTHKVQFRNGKISWEISILHSKSEFSSIANFVGTGLKEVKYQLYANVKVKTEDPLIQFWHPKYKCPLNYDLEYDSKLSISNYINFYPK